MSNMKMTVHALQVRYGQMDDGGQYWANLHVVEDDFQAREGFAGVDIGKLPISTVDANKLAKELHAAAIHQKCLPGALELEMEPVFSLKQTKLVVVGFKVLQPAKA
jgi:hypothetical protein